MRKPLWLLISVIVLFACTHPASSQSLSGQDRDRGLIMLKAVRDDIRKNYYDPSLRGIDLDARTKAAEERIKQAKSNGEVFGIIAQLLMDFNDSHTIFLPPQRAARIEYGWQLQTFGEESYVIAVKPKSDAEAKGLKPGDKVLSIDGVMPTR
ncbi:MAG TPA: hypothetical protein VFR78_11835, partial [Pyrinomonadaceae bacterium]|nr:hypothetical protein [Pyrinomonadaceae bacterium]